MRIVIIGAGPAGLTVAETVRAQDRRAHIVLISAEPHPPYAPPALLDHFTTGRDEPLFWKGVDVCERLGLDFRRGVGVRRLDGKARRFELDNGGVESYDRAVIASGSRLYAPVAGSELAGIANFKSLSAASALVERVRRGEAKRALVVGAGFIGVEVALLLGDLGLEVMLIEAENRVMPGIMDRETARVVEAELRRRGVELRLETRVSAFVGTRRVEHVTLASGSELAADIYVAATGVKPNIDFLQDSGVEAKWGVTVDDALRTNLPDVYAAGDVAETRDRMTGERYVHAIFPNAVEQGRIVGLGLLGFEARYEGAESMNSLKHVGVPIIAVGAASGEEELAYRHGDVLRKVFLRDGKIVGFRLSGDIRASGVYRSLMLRRADVSPYRASLADPGFGVADVIRAASP
jgi:NAD(P)H-nitrite reductase large subunit